MNSPPGPDPQSTTAAAADTPNAAPPGRRFALALLGAFAFQAALLCVVVLRNRAMANPDAVSYIRTASYYLHGQWRLAVNAYWGPMLSWAIAPLLAVFRDPLLAGQVAVGLSGVLFLAGCLSAFRSLGLSRRAVVAGTWLAALGSLAWWSSASVTPDLLLSGLLALGCSRVLAGTWTTRPRAQVAGGLLLGAAYLAKAVALPFAFLFLSVVSAVHLVTGAAAPRPVLRAAARTLAAFAVVAAPWVILLSVHYGRPVISTSGPAAHAIVGPADVPRFHPTFSTWQAPPQGRITTWEDPSLLVYRTWSPFESVAYARHQVEHIWSNFGLVCRALGRFDVVGLGLVALVSAFLFHKPWRANMCGQRWRWAALPVACLLAWYLPVHFQARYCWPAYPFVLAAGLGMADWLTADLPPGKGRVRLAVFAAVVLAFAAPAGVGATMALRGRENASYVCAVQLRARLDAAGLKGPLASVGDDDGTGLYLAFLRGEPWYGNNLHPAARDFRDSGARLYVVERRSPLRERLDAQRELKLLDGVLFASPAEAAACPVAVYGAP